MSSHQPVILLIGNLIGDFPEICSAVRQIDQRYLNSGEKNYRIYEASTAAGGIALWESQSPTLVLVDGHLPDGSGLEFVERLLEQNPNPVDKLPVIVVGEQGDAKTAVRALKLGAMDYLIKDDLTPASLIATINQALSSLQLRSEFEGIQRQNIILQNLRDRLWQSLNVQASLDLVAETALQFLAADRVLVYQFNQRTANANLVAESVVDPALSCRQTAIAQWKNICFGKNYHEAANWRYLVAHEDIQTAPVTDCYRELLEQFQVRANLVVPVCLLSTNSHFLWGLIICHQCSGPRRWALSDTQFIERLAEQLAIAIYQAELYESLQNENQKLEQQLVKSQTMSLENGEQQRAFKLLQDSEQRYATLTSIAPVGIFRTNAQGDCIFFNQTYSRITTITHASKAEGAQWIDLLHPGDRERVLTTWVEKSINREVCCQEFRLCHPEGKIVWVYCQAVPDSDSFGQFAGYVGTMTDITSQKESEAKLRQSEAFLEEAQRIAHIGSWSFDLTTQKITWSDELFRMFGRDPQGPEPNYTDYLNEYLHPKDRPILESYVAKIIADGTPYIFDYRAILPDGTIRHHETRGELEWDQAGNPTRLFGTAIDITERKLYENQLQSLNKELEVTIQERTQELDNSRQFIKTILDTIPLPLFWKDRNSRLLGCNQRLATLMGLDSSDDFKTPKGSEFSPTPDEVKKYQSDDQKVMSSGQPLLGLEETFTNAEGNQQIIETHKAPLRNSDGEIIGLVGVFQDVTERRLAEQEHRRLKERLEFLLSSNPAVIYSCRPGGDYGATFISPNVERLLGYQPQDFTDIPDFFGSHIHPDDVEAVFANLTHLFAEGFHKDEYRFLHRDGHYVWIRDESRLVCDDAGEPLEIVGYFADVSDLRNVEAALRESEIRWQFALEGAGDGIWDWDAIENTVFYSPQWKKMLGYADHDIQNQFSEWENLVHPEDKNQALQDIDRHLTGVTPIYQNEHRLRAKDGSYKWILTRGKIVSRTETGEPLRIIGTHADITERKRAEDVLRKSELHLKMAQRISQIGSWEFDVRSGKITWSETVFHIFGLSESDGPPSFDDLTLMIHPEDRDRHGQTVKNAIKLKRVYGINFRIFRDNGDLAYLQVRGDVLCNAQGEVTQLIGTVQDLTQQKLAEQQLREAKEAAELSNRAKSEFLALMSHEIRTPMNGILGLTHLALQTQPNPVLYDYLQKINQSGQSLLQIINNILDLSKIEAEKLELELSPFQLSKVMKNINDILSPKANEKELALQFSLDPDLPDYLIGDELRLSQIVMNLVSNAVKFTDQGSVAIAVTLGAQQPDAVTVQISVQDTGIGIDPAQHGFLFESFTQADPSISRKYSGTGLGLAVCKRLVDLMGGTIEVYSQLGQGSRFVVSLDFALPSSGVATVSALDRLTSLAGLKCLIAEDIELTRKSLGNFLDALGLRVTAVNSGETAIALLQECPMDDPFELVILDWHMPGLDGITTSRLLKDSAGLTIIPKVLVMTAHDRQVIEPKISQDYVSGILIKPFSVDQLALAIVNLFNPEQRSGLPNLPSFTDTHRLQRIAGAHILVVEDNEINQQVAAELLQSIHLNVDIAPQGYAALAKIAVHHYDLILMDIRMPEMDGYETTRRIRGLSGNSTAEGERFMTVPIVAMTAHAMVSDRVKSLEAGMNDHLSKPIDPQALFLTLLKWIPPRPQIYAPDLCPASHGDRPYPSPSLATVPPIAGLNFNLGITRLAGNQGAYCRLLQRFYLTYQSFPEQLQTLFENQQFDEIINQIHSLKGVSGNLGAETLYRTLSAFDQALKKNHRPPNLSLYYERVQQTLITLLQDLGDSPLLAIKDQLATEQLLTSSTAEKVPLQLLLKSFSDLLDKDLGAAIAIFEQLKRQENLTELQTVLVAMETELENFNLDSVHQHLHVLTTYLDLPHPNGQSPSR